MAVATLIIISGLPCTGKTTLGMRIAAAFALPFLHKDGIKESLFDTLGWKDRSWSKDLSRASYGLLFHFAEIVLSAGGSVIVEANFDAVEHAQAFRKLGRRCAYRPLQILCYARGDALKRRFERRRDRGERHPGHLDDELIRELDPLLRRGRAAPLDIGGRLVEVDTTDFCRIDTDALLHTVRSALAPERVD